MSSTELKVFLFTCDFCRKQERVESSYRNYPQGWDTVAIHNCGMTNYTRYDDRCPECQAQKRGEKE